MYRFTLASADLSALPSGALHWPDQRLLVVSDLHFGKSERLARRGGGLLPPFETRDTLQRLDDDLEASGARRVICLGDSFDDLHAAEAMDAADQLWLTRLMAGRDWTWIEGNHDAGPFALGGSHRATCQIGPLAFRHVATAETPEISGHYHPKLRLAGQARRCFLLDAARVILPAYGSYTGGLWSHDPILAGLMQPNALAVTTGKAALPLPMPRERAAGRGT
ncbi:metallophosphoesterase [Cypionkella aquatica]|uniref:Metallophosphoesterase n=1 Tax=Cypionkella aquatica TaxID=1756042 RepID=A0AA37TVS3_9RHOB|nr:ligase-associated DNA damage response endonuclease PdeM [Cypionkella aquatica]GLS85617.1 metallophosphoesterase [Cypionkella aquatica]